MIGTSLNQYRITASIGAGGMGEVFRARDTRLNRDVAIKVLPKDFASDADRLRRFEQEAKTLAALNHPNVLTIYDAGVHEGAPYLVSELLDGQTLRQVLGSAALTALPVRKATDYGQQIAHGLAAAHGKGIIHRDLKPENIFVTKDGRVKILDFGLAKLKAPLADDVSRRTSKPSENSLPTEVGGYHEGEARTVRVDAGALLSTTEPGMVMGTPAYMAPEQVRGEPADHRTDIFAFGCVLYEMLSGTRTFRRDTPLASMNAILNEEPTQIAELNPKVPPVLDRIVRRCLEKAPEHRFQSASDLAFALESQAGSSTSVPSKLEVSALRRSLWLKRGLAAAILLALGLAVGSRLARRAPEIPMASYQQRTFRPGTIFHSRFAPDGGSIYFSARWGQEPLSLYTTQAGSHTDTPLGLANADLLAVSRAGDLAVLTDIRYLGWFVHQGTLARMKVGEAPRPLLENVTEADWFPDGTSLLVVRVVGTIWRMEEFPSGRILCQTTGYFTYPRVSPAGDRVAFMAHQVRFDDRGWVVILDRSGKTNAISGEWTFEEGLSWMPSGNEVCYSAVKSDTGLYGLQRLSVTGEPGSLGNLPVSFLVQDIGPDGRLLAHRQSTSQEVVQGRAGEKLARSISRLTSDAWSVATVANDAKSYLLCFAGEGSGADYLSFLCHTDGSPALQLGSGNPLDLSPDGRWALVLRYSPSRLVLLPTGVGQPRTIATQGVEPKWGYFLPDGKRILYTGSEAGRPIRFFIQAIDDGRPRPVTPEGIDNAQLTGRILSPIGDRFVASDTNHVPLYCFVDGSPPTPIPNLTAKDSILGWHADGQSVFVARSKDWPYLIYRLDLATGRASDQPVLQVDVPDRAGILDRPWIHVTPDGQAYLSGFHCYLTDLFVVGGLKGK